MSERVPSQKYAPHAYEHPSPQHTRWTPWEQIGRAGVFGRGAPEMLLLVLLTRNVLPGVVGWRACLLMNVFSSVQRGGLLAL